MFCLLHALSLPRAFAGPSHTAHGPRGGGAGGGDRGAGLAAPLDSQQHRLRISPHGPDLSKHLRHLRRLLREFLAEEAKEGTGVPMQCTPTGQHPTEIGLRVATDWPLGPCAIGR